MTLSYGLETVPLGPAFLPSRRAQREGFQGQPSSADGGQTWAEAALSAPVLAYALTRVRIAWKWNGAPTVFKSRATDDVGQVQPTRDQLIAEHGANVILSYNAIQAWRVESSGEVKNVYA
jgi:sulfane dehydrogenase subunit SoxC